MNFPIPSDSQFQWRNNSLYCEDVSLKALAERFGTPLYVYSRKAIETAFKEYNSAADFPHLVCFAVKANSSLAIINLLARLGAGFDIVSGGELKRVLAAGASPDKIVFSGVGKTKEEIRYAISSGIYCLNIESEGELKRVAQVAEELRLRVRVSFRVNPNVDAKTHPYISTGLKQNKFGIPYDQARDIYRKAALLAPWVVIEGISCHIGSQITDLKPFEDAAEKVIDLVEELREDGIELKHIDFGGGLGITYEDEKVPSPSLLVKMCRELLVRRGFGDVQLLLEPGRSLVGNAGVLLMEVQYLKIGEEKNFCIVDAAINDMVRPALYEAWMNIMPVKIYDGEKYTWDIVGPVCESGDWLGREREMVVGQGDYLALFSAGAYGMSMSSNYNSRPRAAEVMVDGDKAYLIRPRETWESLYEGETLIP